MLDTTVRNRLLAALAVPLLCLGGPTLSQTDPTVLLEAGQDNEPELPTFPTDEYQPHRDRMVDTQIERRGIVDPAILDAMRRVPRHRFVPNVDAEAAYRDTPQPIGHGQTISQPYIVGYMTGILELEDDDRVLEVGTGSAYQAAILAEIVDDVVSIEIIRELATTAANRLETMGYENVTVLHGDGYYGYAPRAPFDAIIVTAAAEHTPPPLIEQLKPGGRMVIPVSRGGWTQNLLLVKKNDAGEISTRNLMSVRFVPLTGDH